MGRTHSCRLYDHHRHSGGRGWGWDTVKPLNLDLLFTWESSLPMSLSVLSFGGRTSATQKALFRWRTGEVLRNGLLKAGCGGRVWEMEATQWKVYSQPVVPRVFIHTFIHESRQDSTSASQLELRAECAEVGP